MADIDKIKVGDTTYSIQSKPIIIQDIMSTETTSYNSGVRYSPVYTSLSYDEGYLPGTLLLINEAKIRIDNNNINSGGYLEAGLFNNPSSTDIQSYVLGVTGTNVAGSPLNGSMYLNGTTVLDGTGYSPNFYRPFCTIHGSSYRVAKFTNTIILFGSSYTRYWASSVLAW